MKTISTETYYEVKVKDPRTYIHTDGSEEEVLFSYITTRDEKEIEEWMKKGKAPLYMAEGHGVYSTGRKTWKKILGVKKITRRTIEEVEEIK